MCDFVSTYNSKSPYLRWLKLSHVAFSILTFFSENLPTGRQKGSTITLPSRYVCQLDTRKIEKKKKQHFRNLKNFKIPLKIFRDNLKCLWALTGNDISIDLTVWLLFLSY